MHQFTDPDVLLILGACVALNTVTLMALLPLFRRRRYGYFIPWLPPGGFVVCLGVGVLFTFVGVLGLPWLLNAAVWFAVSLCVFRLTVRQSLKLNFAQLLIFLGLLFGLGAIAA